MPPDMLQQNMVQQLQHNITQCQFENLVGDITNGISWHHMLFIICRIIHIVL